MFRRTSCYTSLHLKTLHTITEHTSMDFEVYYLDTYLYLSVICWYRIFCESRILHNSQKYSVGLTVNESSDHILHRKSSECVSVTRLSPIHDMLGGPAVSRLAT